MNRIKIGLGILIAAAILYFGYQYVSNYYSRPKISQNINPNLINWEKTTDQKTGLSFKYPKQIETKYITAIDWPPQLNLVSGSFECIEAGGENARAGITEKVSINNHTYCVTKESGGAAGSTYTQYAYAFPKDDEVAILTFSLRFVQCENYEDPNKTECKNERNAFNIDSLIDEITQTVK